MFEDDNEPVKTGNNAKETAKVLNTALNLAIKNITRGEIRSIDTNGVCLTSMLFYDFEDNCWCIRYTVVSNTTNQFFGHTACISDNYRTARAVFDNLKAENNKK